MELAERGVVSGYSDGTFHPNETVTRGQFAGMVARALKLPKGNSHFKDVPESKALYDEISRAASAGLVRRIDGMVPGGGIVTDDLLKNYYNELHQSQDAYKSLPNPEDYLKEQIEYLMPEKTLINAHYPDYEIISFNGKAYKDSEIYRSPYPEGHPVLLTMPSQPTEPNQYWIDLHIPYTQFGVYGHDKVTVGQVQPTYIN